MSYKITKNEPIAVYGGGKLGIPTAIKLLESGYNLSVIIDRNPDEVKNSPVPVLALSNIDKLNTNIFIFMSVGIGPQHTGIADTLFTQGFVRLLFLPLYLRSTAAKNMVRAWNTFFVGGYDVEVPDYDSLWCVYADDFIYRKEKSGYVNVMVHKDDIHTEGLEMNRDNHYWSYVPSCGEDLHLKDIPIDSPVAQKHFTENSSGWLSSFYDNSMFDFIESFLDNPASAGLNENGYFNIYDGHHRSVYLINKGFKAIPLRVKKNEWQQYFKEKEAQALMDYCKGRDSLPLPLHHPAFIKFPVCIDEPDEKFLNLYGKLKR